MEGWPRFPPSPKAAHRDGKAGKRHFDCSPPRYHSQHFSSSGVFFFFLDPLKRLDKQPSFTSDAIRGREMQISDYTGLPPLHLCVNSFFLSPPSHPPPSLRQGLFCKRQACQIVQSHEARLLISAVQKLSPRSVTTKASQTHAS